MLERYDKIIEKICGEYWKESKEGRDAGYGVACMLSFLNGTNVTIEDMAKHLKIDRKEIKDSFERLLKCGCFSSNFNAFEDDALNFKGFREGIFTYEKWGEDQSVINAWCHIAGMADGNIYRNLF